MFGTQAVAHDYRRRRRPVVALDSVSIWPRSGTIALVGPNGAGKSTLLRLAATVLPLQRGSIALGERVLRPNLSESDLIAIRSATGYCPQDVPVLPHFTCLEFLDYLGWLAGIEASDRRDRSASCLEMVALTTQANKRTGDLSGGMRRRLGIAQSLLTTPEVLLLDEPTAGLDPDERERFRRLIERLARRMTIVLSTHQLEDVNRLASSCVVMDSGTVLFDGEIEALLNGRERSTASVEAAYRNLRETVRR